MKRTAEGDNDKDKEKEKEETSLRPDPQFIDLNDYVERKNTECLNEKRRESCRDIIWSTNKKPLESDADEQLLIKIHFMNEVRLHSFKLTAQLDGRAPKTVKLFVNMPDMDFSDAEKEKPVQTLTFKEEDYQEVFHGKVRKNTNGEEPQRRFGTTLKNLEYVKFQKVYTVTIFIVDNVKGGDTTALTSLQFFGKHAKSITKVETVIE
ncbi:thioredoxin-like protein 1-like [Planoprotostelium fungivorum]|uniref:Thioredoxin-like protein 1-like n=1 Tax=Planoprotostelium fungivorum TaxID=1890364 RepID=A0A2P6N9V9_9EUKA|nr:thioredoxin-like protein 1-like [Planoprotostelium fungivorum]